MGTIAKVESGVRISGLWGGHLSKLAVLIVVPAVWVAVQSI